MRISRGFLRVPRSKRKNEKVKLLQSLVEEASKKFELATKKNSKKEFDQVAKLVCGVTVKALLEDIKAVVNDKDELSRFVREKLKEADAVIEEGSM